MSNLKYIKEDCIICLGEERIIVSQDDLTTASKSKLKSCPLCNGKGYLSIVTEEDNE